MLIRSQNKEVLTNLNASAGIEIAEGPVKTVITSYITGCSYLLGEYSNKQKAVKVLDMLQKAYAEYEMLRGMSTGMGGIMVTYNTKMIVNELEKEIIECCIHCERQEGCDNRCDMMDSYEYVEECENYETEGWNACIDEITGGE